MRILYVEDNPANVFLVKRVAKMGNHEIINYIDGGQALKKFDEINPHLVLMDIQLSGEKTGLDVVRELRERGVKTPIIAVTAYAMVGDKERCIEAGCDDYLAKPLPIPRLVEIFEEHNKLALASAAAETAVATPPPASQEDSSHKMTTAESNSVSSTMETTPSFILSDAQATEPMPTTNSHTIATQPSTTLSDAKKAELAEKENSAEPAPVVAKETPAEATPVVAKETPVEPSPVVTEDKTTPAENSVKPSEETPAEVPTPAPSENETPVTSSTEKPEIKTS